MNLLLFALPILGVTIAQTPIATQTNTAQTNTLSISGCHQGPYGGVVDCHWRVGANFERKANFKGAYTEYQKALEVSQNLKDEKLRNCAVLSSQARVASIEAVERYFQKNGNGPEAIGVAHDISRLVFVQSLEKSLREKPELTNSCP